jgi:hypothetical protein
MIAVLAGVLGFLLGWSFATKRDRMAAAISVSILFSIAADIYVAVSR